MRGCIIVHGLTGTPVTIASLKERLLKEEFSVATPCLAGHGKTVEALSRTSWQDWYGCVRIAYKQMQSSVEKVYYAGISLGALLGLKLALDEGWGLRALALMGTPLQLTALGRLAVPLVRYTPLRYAMHSVKKNFVKSVDDPVARSQYEAASLPRIPVSSIYQLIELQEVILKDLKKVANPLLLVHAKRDRVAPLENVGIVKRGVSSAIIESLILENSCHVVTMDRERDVVANKIVQFFEKF